MCDRTGAAKAHIKKRGLSLGQGERGKGYRKHRATMIRASEAPTQTIMNNLQGVSVWWPLEAEASATTSISGNPRGFGTKAKVSMVSAPLPASERENPTFAAVSTTEIGRDCRARLSSVRLGRIHLLERVWISGVDWVVSLKEVDPRTVLLLVLQLAIDRANIIERTATSQRDDRGEFTYSCIEFYVFALDVEHFPFYIIEHRDEIICRGLPTMNEELSQRAEPARRE